MTGDPRLDSHVAVPAMGVEKSFRQGRGSWNAWAIGWGRKPNHLYPSPANYDRCATVRELTVLWPAAAADAKLAERAVKATLSQVKSAYMGNALRHKSLKIPLRLPAS